MQPHPLPFERVWLLGHSRGAGGSSYAIWCSRRAQRMLCMHAYINEAAAAPSLCGIALVLLRQLMQMRLLLLPGMVCR